MCNIAGYVGHNEAIPVLVGMMRRQQGFCGGFYTGVTTISEGKIYYEKRLGDLDYLLMNTPASSLKGSIGLLHSRSNSEGGDEWAHPFVDRIGGEPEIAYVANGNAGCCAGRRKEYSAIADRLLSSGYQMSRLTNVKEAYIDLQDGSTVHMSDLMCQLISSRIREGLSTGNAMEAAFAEMPGEIVGLVIRRTEPDRIHFARYNFPMFAGFASHGAFLASTPIAFPEEVERIVPIPAMSRGYITAEGITMNPIRNPGIRVKVLNVCERRTAVEALENALRGQEKWMGDLTAVVKSCFPAELCLEPHIIINELLYALLNTGRLELIERCVPGAREGLTAPKFYMKLKENSAETA